jgi:conjugative transfer region protein (TIGR03748 family)
MDCIRGAHTLPVLAFALVSVMSSSAWPAGTEPAQVGRYSTIAPVPRAAQVDPLQAVVTITFPDRISTVGEGLHYLLRRTGYRFASREATDPAIPVLMRQPLPAVHRRLGPITVLRALTTLAGPAWYLVVDPVHRLVSFDLTRYHTHGVPQYEAYSGAR